jgi:uncharacterized protein YndB with AHSA1/START domain
MQVNKNHQGDGNERSPQNKGIKMCCQINHQIGVKASPEEVFKTLTETKKLAQWWTADTRGSGTKVGDTLEFWFGEFCQKFNVQALEPGQRVAWKAPKGQGADEWEGTEISFDISTDDQQTHLWFKHSGWRENSDFQAHCSMKWATFLLSLKDLLETGTGRPAPNELQINYH